MELRWLGADFNSKHISKIREGIDITLRFLPMARNTILSVLHRRVLKNVGVNSLTIVKGWNRSKFYMELLEFNKWEIRKFENDVKGKQMPTSMNKRCSEWGGQWWQNLRWIAHNIPTLPTIHYHGTGQSRCYMGRYPGHPEKLIFRGRIGSWILTRDFVTEVWIVKTCSMFDKMPTPTPYVDDYRQIFKDIGKSSEQCLFLNEK